MNLGEPTTRSSALVDCLLRDVPIQFDKGRLAIQQGKNIAP
jgi:hypothetical protein